MIIPSFGGMHLIVKNAAEKKRSKTENTSFLGY
jgi:hypothetical protein